MMALVLLALAVAGIAFSVAACWNVRRHLGFVPAMWIIPLVANVSVAMLTLLLVVTERTR